MLYTKIINVLQLLFNHFVNIPLISFILESKKTAVFIIAFGINIFQILLYSYAIEKSKIGSRLASFIIKFLPEKQKIENSRGNMLIRKFGYLGVLILSALPIYAGGVWLAVVTSYTLSLDRKKSILCLIIGSFIGCVLWVLGVTFIFRGAKYILKYLLK